MESSAESSSPGINSSQDNSEVNYNKHLFSTFRHFNCSVRNFLFAFESFKRLLLCKAAINLLFTWAFLLTSRNFEIHLIFDVKSFYLICVQVKENIETGTEEEEEEQVEVVTEQSRLGFYLLFFIKETSYRWRAGYGSATCT